MRGSHMSGCRSHFYLSLSRRKKKDSRILT
jgi:hypothetical protein